MNQIQVEKEIIEKEKLIMILKEIELTTSGKNILKALESVLNHKKEKLSIAYNDFAQGAVFDSSFKFSFDRLLVCLDKLDKTTTNFDKMKSIVFHEGILQEVKCPGTEAYLIAHELAHVVSFLNSGVNNEDEWNLRKGIKRGEEAIGWVNFFKETVEMREVYHGLLLDGFTPKQIIEAFGGRNGLFKNTEEARNVLGLIKGTVDGEEVSIGEGQLFKETMPEPEKSNSIITYLEEPRDLTDVERAVLTVLMNKLHDQSKSVVPQYGHTDAQAALGDAFKGFDLVTSGELSLESAICNTGAGTHSNTFNCINEAIANIVPCTIEKRSQEELKNLRKIAQNIERPIVLVQSNTEDPLNYTVKIFNPDKTYQEIDLSSLQNLKKTEPKSIFLYHNGINHFHTLVPNE